MTVQKTRLLRQRRPTASRLYLGLKRM